MNITEFLQLSPGNEIQQGNHVYRVIHNHAGVVVAQRTVKLSTGDDWSFVPPPVFAKTSSPDAVTTPPPRPSLYDMHQRVLAAGFKFVRKSFGIGWQYQSPSGWFYPTVELAWDAIPGHNPPRETLYSWSPTLEMMKDELYAAGWTFDKYDSLHWTTPNGVLVGDSRTSWKHLQKLKGKR